MTPPTDLLFDIETLINSAQPTRILLLGNVDPAFLGTYVSQKALIQQNCTVEHVSADRIQEIWQLNERFDVAIALNLFEHIEKAKGMQVLSRLRDVLTPQYCLALPLSKTIGLASEATSGWQLTDLFSFALSKVASYPCVDTPHDDSNTPTESDIELGLFKYNISDYKKTPDWLNADNWANPQLWGKYWW